MDIILPDGFTTELGAVFDRAQIGELTGKQQNYLADLKTFDNGLHYIEMLLDDLVQSFISEDGSKYQGDKKAAIKKLSHSDIETILIKIRENTYGPTYLLKANCPHCGAENELKLDLSTLEIKQSPKEDKGKFREITLPRSGLKATMRLMGVDSLQKSFVMFKKQQSELVTTSACLVLKSLNGKQDPTPKDLESLPALDIKFINDEYFKMGGKIDTDVTHECKKCQKDFDTRLDTISPNFFSLG